MLEEWKKKDPKLLDIEDFVTIYWREKFELG